jgi:osmotically-inducible protein OsmY
MAQIGHSSGREDDMRTAIVLGFVVMTGCTREDGEQLARVGRLAGERVRDAAPSKTPLSDLNPEATPAGRVRTRIRTDVSLADQDIQVIEASGGIHLRGRVAKLEQADWAVKLAQETTGVSAVVNELAIGP